MEDQSQEDRQTGGQNMPHVQDAPRSGRAPSGLASVLRGLLGVAVWMSNQTSRFRPPPISGPVDVLLTGTFHSRNWVMAHLHPLVMSSACNSVTVVSSFPDLNLNKVEWRNPPRLLTRLIGEAPARLALFAWIALTKRPTYLGGFHLLFNGLAAIVLAKIVRRRALYFAVGGPAEVERGGLWSENKVFQRIGAPDYVIEAQLLRIIGYADLVVTMGSSAADFLSRRSLAPRIVVLPGGIEVPPLPTEPLRDIDIIFVGRLAPIKRLDLFVQIVAEVAEAVPEVKAILIGDGPMRGRLAQQVEALKLERNIAFAGFQSEIFSWMHRAKLLLMTSDTEGLSLAVMEAMSCGVPCIVRDVGDLGDLVRTGVNGFLVRDDRPSAFSTRILHLLLNPLQREALACEAFETARRLDLGGAAQKWTDLLGSFFATPVQNIN